MTVFIYLFRNTFKSVRFYACHITTKMLIKQIIPGQRVQIILLADSLWETYNVKGIA